MALLLYQNISFRIVKKLKGEFPDLLHVSDCGLLNKDDEEIWKFAKENHHIIVTFDADFYDLQTLKGFPPKLVWLRFGNTTSLEMVEFFRKNYQTIIEFSNSDDFSKIGCLEFY